MEQELLGGRYQIVRRLGSGGFSRTFLVSDLHLPNHPQCVIKQLTLPNQDTGTLEMARRLFDTEARVLYQLSHHPQVPTLLAHFEENREFYLAQEYIEGKPLNRLIREGQTWPETRVVTMLEEVLEILTFVHRQQVIHRDIKPSNLIRRFHDGKLVLIDFGAVKQVSTSPLTDVETGATNLTVSIGTQGYMPNEQYAGKPRFSSDIYAVGMLGIRALTGIHPKSIGEDPVTSELDWHRHAPSVSSSLAAVLDRMVRYDFRDRYPTAEEALGALRGLEIPGFNPGTAALFRGVAYGDAQPSTVLTGAGEGGSEEFSGMEGSLTTADPDSTALFPSQVTQPQTTDSAQRMALIARPPNAEIVLVTEAQPTRHSWRLPLAIGGLIGALGATVALWHSDVLLRISPLQKNHTVSFLATPPPKLMTDLPLLLPPEEKAVYLSRQGDELLKAGRYPDALTIFDRTIRLQSDYAPAYLGRCKALMGLNRPTEAIVACNDALAYRGYYPEAVRSKGNALEQQGQLLAALALYEETNRQMPAMAQGWVDRGRVLQKLGRSAEALEVLNQAILRDRNSAEAWTVRGAANWTLDRYDQAIIALDKALQLQPDQPEARRLRDQARQTLGR